VDSRRTDATNDRQVSVLGPVDFRGHGLSVTSLSSVAYAGLGVWTSGGPNGGRILSLAVDPMTPATFYAGTSYDGGVFKSTDSGGTWNAANMGLTNINISALAINPMSHATLYLGTYSGGVFKSNHSGGTWTAANTGLPDLNVLNLVLDPTGATTLYAGLSVGGVWQFTPATGAVTTALVPSSARTTGVGVSFYTTDLTVAHTYADSARFTLKFLGNNVDGRSGRETTFDLGPEKSVTYTDVLGSVFQRTSDYGAIRVASSDSRFIGVLAQTSTPGFGGTLGQSVPAATAADLIRTRSAQSILAVREDDSFRTNLILTNATEADLDVDVQLVSSEGTALATKRYALAPLGMTQITRVVRELGVTANVDGARLVISTPTPNGAFAAYASAIDNVTNDPRTLLPR
jgi:hypothetical protein